MGFDDLVFNENNDSMDFDGITSQKYIPYKKDLEYRTKIRDLRNKKVKIAVERHKIIMEDMNYYRKNNEHSTKVNLKISEYDKKEEEIQSEIIKTIAQYESYCKFHSSKK